MFVHGAPLPAGRPPIVSCCGHHVNIDPARPVWVIHAPCLNAWNAAVFVPFFIVPWGGVVRVGAGPVILKLVASCSTGGAYFTSTARTYGGSGFENTFGGITKPPPLPPPVTM